MWMSLNMWSRNSAWLAMSARYSKTSSRGLSMFSATETASTPRILFAAAPFELRDRARLRRAHDRAGVRPHRAQRAAQLAHDLCVVPGAVEMDALARQGRPVAVMAVEAIVAQTRDGRAQKCCFDGEST